MKIIIVEDERKSLMGLTALIGQLGERWDIVGTAGNGEEGVRLIAREQPDVVITDVMMEQMDGLEMMEEPGKRVQIHCAKWICRL